MFRSIKYKILALCFMSMLTLALCMGTVSVLSLDRLTGEHEAENMNRVAETQREIINTELIQVENVTRFVADDIQRHINNPQEMYDRGKRRYVTANASRVFQDAVGNVDVVCSYYVYFAEHLGGVSDNLWRVRPVDGGGFEDRPLPSITTYAADDTAHTNWYTLPVQNGQPMWVLPYFYKEQNRYLLSYVVPIFKDGTLVAVIGADIDFKQLLTRIEHLPIYNTSGQAFLTDLSGRVHYTVDHPDGIESTRGGQLLSSKGKFLVPDTHSEELMRYRWNGEEYDMAVVSLRNGLALMVAAPVREIYEDAMLRIVQLVVVFLLLLVIFVLVCIVMSRRMTKKLAELTAMANELANGNWNVTAPTGGKDEIGALCRAFDYSVRHLKESQEELERKTYHDALTGLYNRMGMDKAIHEWWPMRKSAALITLDIDDFKFINDLYGHTVGDDVLKTLAYILEGCFGDIGFVGRNGGDEFVVLLRDVSVRRTEDRVASLCKVSKRFNVGGMEKDFSVSVGYSVYPDLAENLTALFRQADEALYCVKLKGKNGYGIYDAEQEQHLTRAKLGFNLQNISVNLPAAILIYKLDPQNTLLYASEELLRLTGDESLDAMQQRIDDSVLALVHANDRKTFHQDSESSRYKRNFYHLRNVQNEAVAVEVCRRLEMHPIYGEICYAVMVERA